MDTVLVKTLPHCNCDNGSFKSPEMHTPCDTDDTGVVSGPSSDGQGSPRQARRTVTVGSLDSVELPCTEGNKSEQVQDACGCDEPSDKETGDAEEANNRRGESALKTPDMKYCSNLGGNITECDTQTLLGNEAASITDESIYPHCESLNSNLNDNKKPDTSKNVEATEQGTEQGIEQGTEQGTEKRTEKGTEKGTEQGTEKGTECNYGYDFNIHELSLSDILSGDELGDESDDTCTEQDDTTDIEEIVDESDLEEPITATYIHPLCNEGTVSTEQGKKTACVPLEGITPPDVTKNHADMEEDDDHLEQVKTTENDQGNTSLPTAGLSNNCNLRGSGPVGPYQSKCRSLCEQTTLGEVYGTTKQNSDNFLSKNMHTYDILYDVKGINEYLMETDVSDNLCNNPIRKSYFLEIKENNIESVNSFQYLNPPFIFTSATDIFMFLVIVFYIYKNVIKIKNSF